MVILQAGPVTVYVLEPHQFISAFSEDGRIDRMGQIDVSRPFQRLLINLPERGRRRLGWGGRHGDERAFCDVDAIANSRIDAKE